MNRIAEILQTLSTLQVERNQSEQELKSNNENAMQLTLEWQGLCSHPKEYLEEQEDGNFKCCACGYIQVNNEANSDA